MKADKQRGFKENLSCNIFMKPAPFFVEGKMFRRLHDHDLTETYYTTQFNKATPIKMRPIVLRYHPHLTHLDQSQMEIELDSERTSQEGICNLILPSDYKFVL